MSENIKIKWNNIYKNHVEYAPTKVLLDHDYLLSACGNALDLACGLGGNALFLAKKGLQTSAWDISPVAIAQLELLATTQHLAIATQVVAVSASVFTQQQFDVIVVSRYLDRAITEPILQALKPGGLLFYQTFIIDKVNSIGPKNPDYLLRRNELLSLFDGLDVIYYQENACVGEHDLGFRNEAQFIGQKKYSLGDVQVKPSPKRR